MTAWDFWWVFCGLVLLATFLAAAWAENRERRREIIIMAIVFAAVLSGLSACLSQCEADPHCLTGATR